MTNRLYFLALTSLLEDFIACRVWPMDECPFEFFSQMCRIVVLLNLFVARDFTPWFEVCLEKVKFGSQKRGLLKRLLLIALDWWVKFLLTMVIWFDGIIFVGFCRIIFWLEAVLDFVCQVTSYRTLHSSLYHVLLNLSARVLVQLANLRKGCERMANFALLLQQWNLGEILGYEILICSMRTLEKALHRWIYVFVV